nr:reverse transcriptase domain-containing protein [Tanacetum cinerariifolium]
MSTLLLFKVISQGEVKEYQEKDKIRSKQDKKGKRGEAEKSQKQLQSIKKVKLKKMKKESDPPVPDLRTIEELCQPTLNGRGRPIASIAIQAMKLRNEITNFRQVPDESLFEAWERYKLSIARCLNSNMLPVTQIDTFYNRLTLRHRDTINAAAGGTFMKRRPKECYDLIENMTAHHNY